MKCASSHLCLDSTELAPSSEWSPECPSWCFVRVSQGNGYWLGEGGVRELDVSQVVALSPLRDGCFRASQLGSVTLHHFRFSPELAGGLLTPAEHDVFEALAREPGHAVRCLAGDSPGAVLWTGLLSGSTPAGTLSFRLELLRIVAAALATELRQPLPPCAPLSARLKLRLLLNQMPELELLQLTLADLAAHCGIGVTQANRTFRQLFGLSLRERQEFIRLQMARHALAETTRSIMAVAAEAGFRDTRSFAAAFKQRFGIWPAEWRSLPARRRKPRAGLRINGAAREAATHEADPAARIVTRK